MTKFIKTVPIEAEQFDGSDEMVEKYHVRCDTEYMLSDDPLEYQTAPYQIETFEGWLNINAGDWIATGAKGEHWPVADETFKQTYQKLPVISASVAEFIVWCKGQNTPLQDALYFESDGFMHSKQDEERIGSWITDHQDEFARAWLDGYQIDNKS